jgi:deoxyribonuclease V
MDRRIPDEWLHPPSLRAGTDVQRAIAEAVERSDRLGPVRSVAGVDTSMKWRDTRGPIHAAVAPVGWPGAVPRPAHSLTTIPAIPYVPGYLAFRETPAILAVLDRMAERPDLLLVDGHGLAHPRRCGIASHLGVVADMPTIGCGKSLLCGHVEGVLGPDPGDTAPLVDRGEQVGVALRTRARAKPIYVSIGHRISLETAIAWVMKLTDGRRLPIPIRCAHDAANAARRAADGAVTPPEASS